MDARCLLTQHLHDVLKQSARSNKLLKLLPRLHLLLLKEQKHLQKTLKHKDNFILMIANANTFDRVGIFSFRKSLWI